MLLYSPSLSSMCRMVSRLYTTSKKQEGRLIWRGEITVMNYDFPQNIYVERKSKLLCCRRVFLVELNPVLDPRAGIRTVLLGGPINAKKFPK